MQFFGFTLVLVGLLTSFVSFVLAVVNVYRAVTATMGDTSAQAAFCIRGVFKRHVGSMLGLALGGLLTATGLAIMLYAHLA